MSPPAPAAGGVGADSAVGPLPGTMRGAGTGWLSSARIGPLIRGGATPPLGSGRRSLGGIAVVAGVLGGGVLQPASPSASQRAHHDAAMRPTPPARSAAIISALP